MHAKLNFDIETDKSKSYKSIRVHNLGQNRRWLFACTSVKLVDDGKVYFYHWMKWKKHSYYTLSPQDFFTLLQPISLTNHQPHQALFHTLLHNLPNFQIETSSIFIVWYSDLFFIFQIYFLFHFLDMFSLGPW